jgi:hypothetical protein
LIHVRNRARIRINPDFAGEQFDEPRTPGARQADAHARLQNAVALGDHASRRIELRPVQRMSHRAHQVTGGIARKLRVRVQGDDKSNFRQQRSIADYF